MPRIESTLFARQTSDPPVRSRWRTAHDVFLRIVSVVYLVWTLWEWAALIGLVPPLVDDHRTNLPRQGAILFFAALDPVAAVGLWLGSAWGTATWLVVTFARIIIHTGYAGIFGWTGPLTLLQAASVVVYLVLFVMAERAERDADRRRRRREPG